MKVRRLTATDDLSEAVALLQRFFHEEGFDTPDAVIAANTKRLAGIETCGLFLAEQDGRAAGVATMSLEVGIEHGWGPGWVISTSCPRRAGRAWRGPRLPPSRTCCGKRQRAAIS